MGYRLNCYYDYGNFECPKLYGYIDETEMNNLESYKYLIKIKKIDDITNWETYSYNERTLTYSQFIKFVEYYLQELKCYETDNDLIKEMEKDVEKVKNKKPRKIVIRWE